METARVSSEIVDETKKDPILISAVCNAVLVVTKGVVGVIADSHALVADAVHSLSDVIAFAINYYASKSCRMLAEIDKRKVSEQIDKKMVEVEIHSTYLVSIVYLAFGAVTYVRNLIILILGDTTPAGFLALIVAFKSLGVYTWLYMYFKKSTGDDKDRCVTNTKNCYLQNKMNLLAGTAVAIGLIGAEIGFPIMDALAGVVVGAIMISIGLHFLKEKENLRTNNAAALGTGIRLE